jgi:hypothetical protein
VLVPDLDSVDRRVPVDDGGALGAVYPSATLEAVGESTAQMKREHLAVGELDQRPSVVRVLGLLEIGVHGGLTQGEDLVNLLLGVGKTLRDVEVVACDVDLNARVVKNASVDVGS